MASYDNSYSRLIAWLKILLPISALALLSTMFMLSKTVDPTTSLTYARVNLDELNGEQRISQPKFSSVTADGTAITFSADYAAPQLGEFKRFTAEGLSARIETPDGGAVDINAAKAVIDGATNKIDLSGGVTLVTSTQYRIEMPGLMTTMDSTFVESRGAVTAEGPMGQMSAGSASISKQGEEDASYLLVFKDQVKLVYVPQSEGNTE